MKRRLFLGLMSAVGAGGPKALAKAAAPAGLGSLAVGAATTALPLADPVRFSEEHQRDTAKEWLKQLLGMSKEEEDMRMRSLHVSLLDPDTAVLRSMSIGAKVARTRRIQYYSAKRLSERRYRGVIAGIFKNVL